MGRMYSWGDGNGERARGVCIVIEWLYEKTADAGVVENPETRLATFG